MVFLKQTAPFKFSRINHRPLAIMNGWNKSSEMDTVPLT